MTKKEQFEKYLSDLNKSEKTISNYIGAFTFNNTISESLGLGKIEEWNDNEVERNISRLKQNKDFIERDTTGNRMYSSSLSSFQKFISTKNQDGNKNQKMGKRQLYIAKVKEIASNIKAKSFDQLKASFQSEYDADKEYALKNFGDYSVESRLSFYPVDNVISSETKNRLQSVIANIKSTEYRFNENDIEALNLFCKKIDYCIHQCQYLTTIYHGEINYVKNHSIDLPALFNEIKDSSTAAAFFEDTTLPTAFLTNKNFKSFLKYLFSCVKNCQDKANYPLFYKFYQNIAYWFYRIEMLNYDAFCQFYATLDLEDPKGVHFNLLLHLLAYNLKMELEGKEMLIEQVDKTFVKNNIFNYDNTTLDVTSSTEHTLESINYENQPPEIPFVNFGWRWATTGISSHLNRPNSLRAVLDAVLINGNGKNNQTDEFKDLLLEICVNKYEMSPEDAEKLAKKGNNNPVKNIIENSGNYWTHLGLFSETGMNAVVSPLGVRFLTGVLPQDEFVVNIIEGYKLPSPVFKRTERDEWDTAQLKIFPFKILLKVYEELHRTYGEEHHYLTEEDIKFIIVPFSVKFTDSRAEELVFHIVGRRQTPSDYTDWPKCFGHYTEDKGERMINEFPFFLECFGFLSSNMERTRSDGKQYYATQRLTKLFGIDSSSIGSQTYSEQTKKNQIFFGAPGTGKSYRVKKKTSSADAGNRVFRTTFHPDYDHNTFVGGYRPINTTVKDENGMPKAHQFQISYKFVPQVFTKAYVEAWNNLDKDYYLIVEEINRGNCAEIFGDLFQLLDRDDDGYPVIPSQELHEHLESKLHDDGVGGIKDGKMSLPRNLNILATMNTSDQSLFPMDSAFKRRWDWVYVPIEYGEIYQDSGKENESYNYFVRSKTSDLSFKWIDFIRAINKRICSVPHLGEDKQIGNYFIKGKEHAGELVISLDDFVHKVIFYLWNDVFKDEERDDNNIFKQGISYQSFFPVAQKASEIIKDILADLDVKNSSMLAPEDEDPS